MASVKPRINPSGTLSWRVQFRVGGRVKQETFLSEDGAKDFGLLVDKVGGETALQILASRQKPNAAQTLKDFTDRYLDPSSGLLSGVTEGTRSEYESIARRSFLTDLGELPINLISKNDIGGWITRLERKPAARGGGKLTPKTVKNYHALLSAIFAAAVDEGIIESNPARGIKISRGMLPEMVFLTPEEFDTLLYFIPEYYKPLTIFLAATGLRWGEATALTFADLNMSTSPPSVRVNKAWKRGKDGGTVLGAPKTARSNRTVSIWPELIETIQRAGSKKGDLIFSGMADGNRVWPQTFRRGAWLPAIEKANDIEACAAVGREPIHKRPRVHDLRHSHASWLIHSGTSLTAIQRRLGHEKITTTSDTYGHLMPDAQTQLAHAAQTAMSFPLLAIK